jgi:hypothetical protein
LVFNEASLRVSEDSIGLVMPLFSGADGRLKPISLGDVSLLVAPAELLEEAVDDSGSGYRERSEGGGGTCAGGSLKLCCLLGIVDEEMFDGGESRRET